MMTKVRLLGLTSIATGMEMCASVVFTTCPSILQSVAALSTTQMSILYGIGLFLALLTVPMLGSWSDNCKSLWGRRRPFIIAHSLALMLSLVFLIMGIVIIGSTESQNQPITSGVVLVVVGMILLDYTSQAALNPIEALVADMSNSCENISYGFRVYSVSLSFGSCLGFVITGIDWTFASTDYNILSPFVALLLLLPLSLLVTLFVAEEKIRRSVSREPSLTKIVFNGSDCQNTRNQLIFSVSENLTLRRVKKTSFNTKRIYIKRRLHLFWNLIGTKCVTFFKSFYDCPGVLKRLFFVDLCSWLALMAQSMFYTDFVGKVVYQGQPGPLGSKETAHIMYQEGCRMASLGLLFHSISAILFVFFVQERILKILGTKYTYISIHILFSICMLASVIDGQNIFIINTFATISGILFAASTTIPCTIVLFYARHPQSIMPKRGSDRDEDYVQLQQSFCDKDENGKQFSLLDMSYYLAQILLSLFLGFLVEWANLPELYMIFAALFAAASAFMSFNLVYEEDIRLSENNESNT